MESCGIAAAFDRRNQFRVLREAYDNAFGDLAAAARLYYAVRSEQADSGKLQSAQQQLNQASDTYRQRRDALARLLRPR